MPAKIKRLTTTPEQYHVRFSSLCLYLLIIIEMHISLNCFLGFGFFFSLQVVRSDFTSRERFLVRPNDNNCVFEEIKEEDL